MNAYEFGQRIKARRLELRLGQKDLGNALGLDQGKISLLEKGARRVDVATELPLLCTALNWAIPEFLCEEAYL